MSHRLIRFLPRKLTLSPLPIHVARFPSAPFPRVPFQPAVAHLVDAVALLLYPSGSVHVTAWQSVRFSLDGMQFFIFARFQARDGDEDAVADAMRDMLGPTRAEAGCLEIQVFRGTRGPRLFFIHSCWIDEGAFDVHAGLPHTLGFIERVQPLIDHARCNPGEAVLVIRRIFLF